jgi:hypothetical protein
MAAAALPAPHHPLVSPALPAPLELPAPPVLLDPLVPLVLPAPLDPLVLPVPPARHGLLALPAPDRFVWRISCEQRPVSDKLGNKFVL